MEKLSFDKFILITDKNIFENYYYLHTKNECLNYFNISEHTYRRLLIFWDVEKKNKKISDLNYTKEFVEEYYYSHTAEECLKFFNISGASFYKWLKDLQIDYAQNAHKNSLISIVNKETLYELYIIKNYGVRSCAEFFGVSVGKINELLAWYNIESKSQEQKNETTKTTNLLKYNVEYSAQNKEIQAKVFNTKLERYGDGTFTNIEKAKKTNLEKYGVEYATQSPEIQSKIHKTMQQKYGVDAYTQTIEYHKKAIKKYYYDNISFDSFPELAVYIYAIDHNIQVERLPIKLMYSYNNKTHRYFPDFLYNNKLLEIKNDYLFNKMQIPNTIDNAKFNCMIDNNVVIWTSADYAFAEDYFKTAKYNLNDFLIKKEV